MKKNKGEIIGKMKNNKGITLLALAVTIVVLLILTSIGLKLALGDNGIIGEAKNAKELSEIDDEKGIVKRATTVSLIKSKGSKVEQDTLEKALNDETGEGKTEVSDVGNVFEVMFKETNRYYEVDKEGNISDANKIIKADYVGDITKGGKCDGSAEKPYEISCIEDLVVFSNIVNGSGIKFEDGKSVEITTSDGLSGKNIILTKDLNFKSRYSYDDYTRTDFGNLNGDDTDGNSLMTEMTTGSGFVPIGYSQAFSGNFDGQSHKITNIFECADTKLGLFGYIYYANIKNIYVEGNMTKKNIEKTDIGSSIAGIVGWGSGTCNISNCISNVDIVANCYGAGGIFGRGFGTLTILNCVNLGKITNKSDSIGGIAGRPEGGATYIYNCCNIGNIVGYNKGGVGGIVGDIVSSEERIISNVYNVGTVKNDGAYGAGGIIGRIYSCTNVTVDTAFNLGNILGSVNSGAVCGFLWDDSSINISNFKYVKSLCDNIVGNGDNSEYDGAVGVDKLTGEELVEKLNANAEEHRDWKKWKLGSDGYPVFE